MEKRLLLFLQSEDLNPTRFADKIGVQRSSISHILSGRNKPSYDFLLKTLEAFPLLNAEWLLTGKGKMYKSETLGQASLFDQVTSEENDKPVVNEDKSSLKQALRENVDMRNISVENEEVERVENVVYKSKQEKKNINIEKIVIFYSDKTYCDYVRE